MNSLEIQPSFPVSHQIRLQWIHGRKLMIWSLPAANGLHELLQNTVAFRSREFCTLQFPDESTVMGTDQDRATAIAAESIGIGLKKFFCQWHDCDEFVGGSDDIWGKG
jgi:hypothetical protein